VTEVLLPFPRLLQRYVCLKDAPSAERLRQAETVTAGQLAEEFKESAVAHGRLPAINEPFLPTSRARDGAKSTEAERRTFGWSMAVKRTLPHVVVAGAPDLNFRYVEREIIPTRTAHRPVYENGPPATKCASISCSRTCRRVDRSSPS
jgi:hypothetical protein